MRSDPFLHVVFSKSECEPKAAQPLLVFVPGDGRSWIHRGRVSRDPTPKRALALDLMDHGDACGFVVSRPCSFGLIESDPACEPSVWTTRRYSEDVVRSMAAVIAAELGARSGAVLVGVSGGGRIAAHVAGRMSAVEGLVTLGTNLDLPGWLDHHGYTHEIRAHSAPLPDPLRPGLVALHVVGKEDRVSPPPLTRAWLEARAAPGILLELGGVDHTTGWVEAWPRVLERLQQLSESAARSPSSSSTR